jgi:hypothetical protein
MNVLDFYNSKHIQIGEPLELEDNNYFCKVSYNNAPFIIKTNKVCYYKNRKSSNYVYISVTSKEYLEWFELFYHDSIEKFHAISKEWFEEEMTHSDIECSFINPLKTNIKDNCFDIMCSIDENRMMVTDTNDNIHAFSELVENEVIPTFHIKGIKFNSKHFALEIELNHLYILLPTDEIEELSQELPFESGPLSNSLSESVPENVQESVPETLPQVKESEELSEYIMKTENIEEAEIHLDNLTIYKIYEFLNTRIKESLIEEIRGVFTSKKIKSRLDFSEVIDDEETDE